MNLQLGVLLCACLLVVGPFNGAAQQVPRIALLAAGPPECPTNPAREAFFQRLGEFGYAAGKGLVVDSRCYGAIAEVPRMLTEVLPLKPDVIVAGDSQVAVAAKKATGTIPIVFMNSSDPVQAGVIASFARPGGNATGVGNLGRELTEKRVELLKQAVPSVARIGVVWNLTNKVHEEMWKGEFSEVGRWSRVVLLSVGVRSASDLGRAFTQLKDQRAVAVLLMPDGLLFAERDAIARLAYDNRMPTIHSFRPEVEAGGLMSYGPDRIEMASAGGSLCRQSTEFKLTAVKLSDLPGVTSIPNRQLDRWATGPDQVWVGDITYVTVGGAWRGLAVVLDRYSRRVLGWSLGAEQGRAADPGGAQPRRRPSPAAAGGHLSQRSGPREITDTAHMESFFHSMKSDAVHGVRFTQEAELRTLLRQYVPSYNSVRLHSGIGYSSRIAYEAHAR